MPIVKIALVLVILVDVMGQGLAFPIFSVLMLSEHSPMLSSATTTGTRQILYGVLVGAFFLSWFLGAIYISRISDSLGRKKGIMICLTGTLAGYVLSVVAILTSSFWLLLVSRVITGFTAGNQPIAQAALVDLSADDADRARNMGLVMLGAGTGLVAGPIIGGLFSNAIFGTYALLLPFIVGAVAIAATMAIVALGFHETSKTRVPLSIEPAAVFTLMWEVTRRPVILRISAAYLGYMFSIMIFYVFFDNALDRWFSLGTTGQSAGMFVLGIVVALTSTLLLPKIAATFTPRQLVVVLVSLEAVVLAIFVGIEWLPLAFVMIAILGFVHAVMYPTFLGLYSAATGPEDQGWVMGVSIALFTLASAIASLAGGVLGAAFFDGLFWCAVIVAITTLGIVALCWRGPAVRAITDRRG